MKLVNTTATPILMHPYCKGACDTCFYTDECRGFEQGDPTGLQYRETLSVSLCASRHEIPEATDGAIFPETVPVVADPGYCEALEAYARQRILGCHALNLYVTGMTVALIATLNAARELNSKVVLYHYDRETGEYFPQYVA